MAVVSARETIGRSLQQRFGEAPSAERVFVVTLDDPATTADAIAAAAGIALFDAHPETSGLVCTDLTVTEGDPSPYHATVTASYGVIEGGEEQENPDPTARPDVWSFSTSMTEVPATDYYEGDGNSTKKAIVNAAGDPVPVDGLTTATGELRASVSGARLVFPLADALAITGAVNADEFAGGDPGTWQCQGISASQASEFVNGSLLRYWEVNVELVYRQEGFSVRVPNVGFHEINEDGEKSHCTTATDEPTIRSYVSSPVPLDENGAQKEGDAEPDMIEVRVHPEVNFQFYFGTPPV